MAGTERGLKDLKSYAESSLFSDLKVTPEMKARLFERVRKEEARRAPAPRPWLRRGPVASAAAVAAVGIIVAAGQYAARPPRQVADTALPTAAAKTEAAPPVHVANGPVQLTLLDTAGNTVSYATAAPGAPGVEAQPGRKIILNSDYTLEVKDARHAMEQLTNLAAANGGYVVEASLNRDDRGNWQGRVVLRVPAGNYSGAVEQVRKAGEVKQERQWSQDVTAQYLDLETRIRIQKEHEQKLEELAQKAATFDDFLKLTKELNETRAQVENMEGQLKLLANQVDYSTITVSLEQPGSGITPVPEGSGIWGAMVKAFYRSLAALAGLGRSLLVGLAAVLPFAVPAALLGGGAWLMIRRRRKHHES